MTTPDALLAVDEALRSGRADASDPVERELQEIALALRAEASPAPDPEFERRLDERVSARFARQRPRRRIAPSVLPRRRLVLACAAGLLTVVAIGGAVAGLSGRESRTAEPELAAPQVARPAHPEGGAATDFALKSGGARNQSAGAENLSPLPAAGRRVERDAELTLAAPADELADVADGIVKVTDRHRGVVLDSSLSTGSDSGRGGSFSLRVPTTELTATLRDLSRLGQVRARSESGHDVTRSYSSLTDRLASARLERRALARRLSHAPSAAEGDRLRARIDALTQEIHGLGDQLGRLRVRTDYTRIAVTLVERRAAASPWQGVDDALRGSLRALVGAVAITLRVLAALLPFALLGALGWAATGAARRRRREAVLS
jgi:hypothetical protein